MEQVILIKYGELSTKKGNRNFFVKTLYQNVLDKLKNYSVSITKDLSRMYITFDIKDRDVILSKINEIFGIHAYHVANKVPTDIEKIEEAAISLLKEDNYKTFKVESKRRDPNFTLHSMELNQKLGGVILRNIPGIKVDVHNPDCLLQVEVREGYSYLYTKTYYGLGGYPNGTQSGGFLMLSGGIDSPVAGYLAMKRGIKLSCIYFEALPHTSLNAREKVISLTKRLAKYQKEIRLYIVPFTKLQEAIYQYADPTYMITIMRRMMYRISATLAKRNKNLALINGESVGQVASQTLNSMSVINEVTNMPVIRPVACLDKLEIIALSKKIDTYDISILPYEDCCTVFVPKHPVINPSLEKAYLEEKKFNYQEMIDQIIEETVCMKIHAEENNYDDLL